MNEKDNYAVVKGTIGKYSNYGGDQTRYYFGTINSTTRYTTREGEEREYTDYISITGHNQIADELNSLKEGTEISVEGKLKSSKDKKTNTYKTYIEVQAIHKGENVCKGKTPSEKPSDTECDTEEDKYGSIVFSGTDLPF